MMTDTAGTPLEGGRGRCHNASSEEWFSTRLWQIEWSNFFPYSYLSSHSKMPFSVHLSSYEKVAAFMAEYAADIYQESESSSGFLPDEQDSRARGAKRRFYQTAVDIFEIREQDKVIGILTANPLDWSTYYLRNVSILSDYQQRGVFQPFFTYLLGILSQHGVQRAEAEVSPSNFGQVHLLNKLGFNIAGVVLSERWGSMARFTKFFSQLHEEAYLEQFCYGVRPQTSQFLRRPRVDA